MKLNLSRGVRWILMIDRVAPPVCELVDNASLDWR